jgi:16S rRNA processing protein RimM
MLRGARETLAEKDSDRFLAIARIVRPQGRRGEVVAEVLTDYPSRFQELRTVLLENPGHAPDPLTIEGTWPHKGRVVIKFSGVDSIEGASQLRGRCILIPRDQKTPLPEHHYYFWELKGCQVVAEKGGRRYTVGTVTEVEPIAGVHLLHVERRSEESGRPRSEVLIPLAQEICRHIDTQAKLIVIDPPEDLLDLNS